MQSHMIKEMCYIFTPLTLPLLFYFLKNLLYTFCYIQVLKLNRVFIVIVLSQHIRSQFAEKVAIDHARSNFS